ncbi:MAG: transposase [Actinomycetota bacterium]|nr:transposase [Actinomycetota bacterium]
MSGNRGRRPYPPEFRREAVELYRRSDKSLQVIAEELGIATESLRAWTKQYAVDAGERQGLTSPEREELRELRRKLLRVEQERDLLKRAAAFFAAYRPFCKQRVYMDPDLNEVMSLQPAIFPPGGPPNLAIVTTGPGARREFSALVVDAVPNLHHQDSGQSFPRYTFEPAGDQGSLLHGDTSGYVRTDNIAEATLERFREHYEDPSITADDVFFYVYGAVHSPAYRQRFASELRRSLARIPLLEDFDAYAAAGRELSELHAGYEQAAPYELDEVPTSSLTDPKVRYRVEKMRFGTGKDRTTIVYNAHLTLDGIPERAYEYEVNGRPAIEWIIDRYQIRTDKDSGIVNDPNAYSDDPRYIVDLLRRIVTVSLKTLEITDQLRELESAAG